MSKVQFRVKGNEFGTWQEINVDYLVVSDDPNDHGLIANFIQDGFTVCSLGLDNTFDTSSKEHRVICIYNETNNSLGTAKYPRHLNMDYIHVFFFGDPNKQHALVSKLCLAPGINRRKLNMSNQAGIWELVKINPNEIKSAYCTNNNVSIIGDLEQ